GRFLLEESIDHFVSRPFEKIPGHPLFCPKRGEFQLWHPTDESRRPLHLAWRCENRFPPKNPLNFLWDSGGFQVRPFPGLDYLAALSLKPNSGGCRFQAGWNKRLPMPPFLMDDMERSYLRFHNDIL